MNPATQLTILTGLRIVEHLNSILNLPSEHDILISTDDDHLLLILNFLTLCLDRENSSDSPEHDIAAAISTTAGHIVLHLAKPDGIPPTPGERSTLAAFLNILRDSASYFFATDMHSLARQNYDPVSTYERFLRLIAEHAFSSFSHRLSRIGAIEPGGPLSSFSRFRALIHVWLQHVPTGEQSPGFVRAASLVGGATTPTDMLVHVVHSLMHMSDTPKPDPFPSVGQRCDFIHTAMNQCTLLANSTFFAFARRGKVGLDLYDAVFTSDLVRRIMIIANYSAGCLDLCLHGFRALTHILGEDGLRSFTSGSDDDGSGITVNWITADPTIAFTNKPSPHPHRLCWPTSPQTEINRVLHSLDLDFDLDLGSPQPDSHAHNPQLPAALELAQLWDTNQPVSPPPVLHAEMQLVSYLEAHSIAVVGGVVGTRLPPCWACHTVLAQLGTTGSGSANTSSHSETGGGCPSVIACERQKYATTQPTGRSRPGEWRWLFPWWLSTNGDWVCEREREGEDDRGRFEEAEKNGPPMALQSALVSGLQRRMEALVEECLLDTDMDVPQ